ncbi:MAG TPA: DUF4190 domain-containing protein [Luteolibacter sp.]|nr:DUF4190 domain-containing protein [Luteolibacter sp.]
MDPSTQAPYAPAKQSGLATVSLICGILALPTCYATFLPAVILGHIAWSKGDRPSRAKWGLITGYGSIVLLPVLAMIAGMMVPLIMKQKQAGDRVLRITQCKSIGIALASYQNDFGHYPADLWDLERKGHISGLESMLSVDSGAAGDWLYFPKASPGDSQAPLLVSPRIGHQFIVLHNDLSVSTTVTMPADDSAVHITPPLSY